MGRKRSIDRKVTMDAIEAVVRQSGVAGLSIDAVAREAGISKSSVLYDFENKHQMLSAFIKSRLDRKREQIADCAARQPCDANRWLRALLDCSATAPSEEEMATAMLISAGMGTGDTCRALMKDAFAEDMRHVVAESDDPRMARLAWLALNGMLSMEYFGFHSFPEAERAALLADISWLMTAPSPSPSPSPSPLPSTPTAPSDAD